MSILSAVGGLVKKAASTLKSTFAPSVEEGKARRTAVFGTESLAVTSGAVALSAAAAIAAPVLVASGAATKAAQSVGSAFLSASLPKQAGIVGGGLIAAGAVARQPTIATKAAVKAPSSLLNFGGNLADVIVSPSKESVSTVFTENPFTAALVSAAVLGAAGKAATTAAGAYSSFSLNQSIKENTEAMQSIWDPSKYQPVVLPPPTNTEPPPLPTDDTPPKDKEKKPNTTNQDVVVGDDTMVSDVPITPETQVLGKPAGSTKISRRKKALKRSPLSAIRQNLRVNIYNQGKHLYTGRVYA